MHKLIAKTPLDGQEPATHGGLTLSELGLSSIISIAPFTGREAALAKALKPLGLTFPQPNQMIAKDEARLVWTGRDQAFLLNAVIETDAAALTDQGDGWAGLRLEGAGAEDALMRLYPLDLRMGNFPPGSAARAPLNHMSSVLMRPDARCFEILVFRSMAQTAWNEIAEAMAHLAARNAVN